MNKDTLLIKDPVLDDGVLQSTINTLQTFMGNKKTMYDILSNDSRSFEYLPLTVSINVVNDNYKVLIKNAMKSGIKMWILKPALGLQGNDIIISNDFDKIIRFIEKHVMYTDWVLSQYIDKPFLLKINGKSNSGAKYSDVVGRKTHIRIYVLITKIDNIFHIYLYKHNLIFCAAAEYNPKDLKYKYSNLTNLHLGSFYYKKKLKLKAKYAYKDLSFPLKESIGEIFSPKFYDDVIFPQIKSMMISILDNFKDYLQCAPSSDKNNRGCFHTIAIDIMPDSEFKLYLLEINSSPGLNAPSYHWGQLDDFANSLLNRTVDVITGKNKDHVNNKGFILIK